MKNFWEGFCGIIETYTFSAGSLSQRKPLLHTALIETVEENFCGRIDAAETIYFKLANPIS
jgi:hypothetical protein